LATIPVGLIRWTDKKNKWFDYIEKQNLCLLPKPTAKKYRLLGNAPLSKLSIFFAELKSRRPTISSKRCLNASNVLSPVLTVDGVKSSSRLFKSQLYACRISSFSFSLSNGSLLGSEAIVFARLSAWNFVNYRLNKIDQ
jgi:hypothetical protein